MRDETDISFELWKDIRDSDNYLQMDELDKRSIYFISARNSHFGIWNSNNKSFIISRCKFDNNYLFEEYHWDTGEPFGTVKPLTLLKVVPAEICRILSPNGIIKLASELEEEVLVYLNELEKEYSFNELANSYLKEHSGKKILNR